MYHENTAVNLDIFEFTTTRKFRNTTALQNLHLIFMNNEIIYGHQINRCCRYGFTIQGIYNLVVSM